MKNWLLKKKNMRNKLLAAVIMLPFLFLSSNGQAAVLPETFPRLANYFLQQNISDYEARNLAKWDLAIIGFEAQYNNPEIFRILREKNPDVIILAYVASEEVSLSQDNIKDVDHPHYKLLNGISDGWWLRDSSGNYVSYWPGTKMLNVTQYAAKDKGLRWNDYLPKFMHEQVMSTGLWDGIFYDNCWQEINWLNNGNLDLNNDGIREPANQLDIAWAEGMAELLANSRNLEGNDTVIIGNGGGEFYTSLNGRMIEEFPSDSDGQWTGAMEKYFNFIYRSRQPSIVIINSKTNSGHSNDYQSMRYTLTSSLLNDGFYSFDYGAQKHSDLWWYDEYSVYLGKPLGGAQNLLSENNNLREGVWRRDYQNAIVIVNSTDQAQNIELGGGFEKISGSQDSIVNNGQIVSSVSLNSHDGVILLKRYFEIENGYYINGAYGKVFDKFGGSERQGFFTYNSGYAGGLKVLKKDINNDGRKEMLVAWNDKIQIYNADGFLTREFYPYGSYYNRGINFDVGDIDGDGRLEIVTGTELGGGPHVRIFNSRGNLKNPGFFAYAEHFRGGVHVAVGDVDGNGIDEIVTGAGYTGGPHVRIFDKNGKPLYGYFAYDERFRGGVSVSVADLNNDGKAEIITGAGPGGGPHVRILNHYGNMVLPGFFAYNLSYRGGIEVTTADIDQDGIVDIIAYAKNIY